LPCAAAAVAITLSKPTMKFDAAAMRTTEPPRRGGLLFRPARKQYSYSNIQQANPCNELHIGQQHQPCDNDGESDARYHRQSAASVMPSNRWRGGSPWQAIATGTRLFPDSRISKPCRNHVEPCVWAVGVHDSSRTQPDLNQSRAHGGVLWCEGNSSSFSVSHA
jgi:hypothetical protein